jgi:hypothetical protein
MKIILRELYVKTEVKQNSKQNTGPQVFLLMLTLRFIANLNYS